MKMTPHYPDCILKLLANFVNFSVKNRVAEILQQRVQHPVIQFSPKRQYCMLLCWLYVVTIVIVMSTLSQI